VPIKYARAKDLLEADVGEDIVALDVDGGLCFGFNSVAAEIWRLLDQPKEFDSLLHGLMAEFDVDAEQCATELHACLTDLESKGLVRRL